ncbi:MAG: hypothetical protein Q8N30_03605 [Methylococcales bacterium]|nr:hypothetical protein [Methylococcales bacterium]
MWAYHTVGQTLLIFPVAIIMGLVVIFIDWLKLNKTVEMVLSCFSIFLFLLADGPPRDLMSWFVGIPAILGWCYLSIACWKRGGNMKQVILGVFIGMHVVRYIVTGSTGLNMFWWMS